jgi:nucleoid-associated protein YgaU
MPDPSPPVEGSHLARNLLLGALGLASAAAVAMFVLRAREEVGSPLPPPAAQAPVLPAPLVTPHAGNTAPAGARPTPSAVAPSFDIVRVNPQGSAVIAGRGDPGAAVSVRSDGAELGHVTADGHGAWVLGPTDPLPPGSHTLALRELTQSGREIASEGSVLMMVPERQATAATQPPLTLLTGPAQAPRVLQGPPGEGSARPGQLGLGAVDYGSVGEMRLSGTAHPGSALRLYADNKPIGEARADQTGRWTLSPGEKLAEGTHQLRLDQLGSDGKVTARVELPFRRENMNAAEVASGKVVVQPGSNLWRIASHAYGQGVRYIIIYQANRDQIRNPRLIYPGQVFTVPEVGTKTQPGGAGKAP